MMDEPTPPPGWLEPVDPREMVCPACQGAGCYSCAMSGVVPLDVQDEADSAGDA